MDLSEMAVEALKENWWNSLTTNQQQTMKLDWLTYMRPKISECNAKMNIEIKEKNARKTYLECLDCKFRGLCKFMEDHKLACNERYRGWCKRRGVCVHFEEGEPDENKE